MHASRLRMQQQQPNEILETRKSCFLLFFFAAFWPRGVAIL